ncbi:hypothetical protein [Streptosporangium sp. NBC_01756]|uniref:hypothetical protein n=1 Tax=Streptosporangium sp. NBC_01756 TaxID=2975950 RepID=UPI002DD8BC7D|nr:hypothetical protein [Streptosporangium sp. NBC_01756]WSC83585.1 hypothetical protein OIE48_24630 [Streptosporangium sp. NBC_01756]
MAATNVGEIKAATPSFGGWNLVPGVGIPIIGLLYVNRINAIGDVWADCAGILKEVLETDSEKLATVAENYRSANETAETVVGQTNH